MAKNSHKGNVSRFVAVRNLFFSGGLLVWAFAGLDGALSKDLGSEVFLFAARGGGLLLVAALSVELSRRFFERGALSKMFEAKKVTRGELVEARAFSEEFLPEVPSLEQLQRIFEASRGCVWFVNRCELRLGRRKTERVGFFSLIRLTAAAVELYKANSLNSFKLDRSHIAGPRAASPGLYIGGLGANGFRARGWVVQYLRSRLDQFFEQGGKVVFTRPVTDDGLRLAESLGFFPAMKEQVGLGNVYRLDSSQ